jgi:hypothetical protein
VSQPAKTAVESKTDSQEAVVNIASETTVCNRAIVIPTVKSGIKSVKDQVAWSVTQQVPPTRYNMITSIQCQSE